MRIAICPGSYDPVTFGHLNIIERSAGLFDKVIVAVMVNPNKQNWFSDEERVQMVHAVTRHIPNVEVLAYNGLVANLASEKGACALVKGLRAVTDFEYEFQMALINKKLNPQLETIFITTAAEYMYLSSSAVREIAVFGGDLKDSVPEPLQHMIWERFSKSQEKEDTLPNKAVNKVWPSQKEE